MLLKSTRVRSKSKVSEAEEDEHQTVAGDATVTGSVDCSGFIHTALNPRSRLVCQVIVCFISGRPAVLICSVQLCKDDLPLPHHLNVATLTENLT